MKYSIKLKIIALFAFCAASSVSLNASVTLTIGTAGWGNTTAPANGMTWGVIIDTSGGSFLGASAALQTALQGFTIPTSINPSNPVQIGSTSYYFAEAQAQTATGGPPTFSTGLMNTASFNLNSPVATGQSMGLLWFAENTTTAGSHFGFQTLGGANTVPSNGSTITSGITSSPGLATFTIGAAPEPSRLMLTALGLGTFLVRRRRVA